MQTSFTHLRETTRHRHSRRLVACAVFVAALATMGLAALAAAPETAAVINPCACTGRSIEALHAEFPALPRVELERLLFRVAEMQSRAALAH